METKEQVNIWFEKDPKGNPTGLTVCDINGFRGFAFCWQGEKKIHTMKGDDGTKITNIYQTKGDDFDRKTGREIAIGRAKKFAELIKAMPEDQAYNEIYSARMQNRIKQYYGRHLDHIQARAEKGRPDNFFTKLRTILTK